MLPITRCAVPAEVDFTHNINRKLWLALPSATTTLACLSSAFEATYIKGVAAEVFLNGRAGVIRLFKVNVEEADASAGFDGAALQTGDVGGLGGARQSR